MEQQNLSRLGMIMDALNISGKELAAALHVDHSLVSKWRNNKRSLLPHSSHSQNLAEVLLAFQERSEHKILYPILRAYSPTADLEDPQKAQDVLRAWLTDRTPSSQRPLWAGQYPEHQGWYDAQFRIWPDNAGRRRAVLDFLDQALAEPPGQTLQLISQEDMQWIVEDPEFVHSWQEKLRMVLQYGHRIEVIHWVDRDPASIQPVLESWLPLHLTGRIQSWFYPSYVDLSYRLTLFLLKGRLALVGMQPAGGSSQRLTALYGDPISQTQYEAMFAQFVSECQPLVKTRPTTETCQLLDELLGQNSGAGETTFWVSSLPPASAYSSFLLAELMESNAVPAELRDRCHHYHRLVREHWQGRGQRWLVSLEALRAGLAANRLLNPELSVLTGQAIVLNGDQIRRHLAELQQHLLQSENCAMAFVETSAMTKAAPINLWIEENHAVVAWSEHPQLSYSATAIEPTVVRAFYQHYEERWNSVPRIQREPESVARHLETLLQNRD